jgi:hypothetical protein
MSVILSQDRIDQFKAISEMEANRDIYSIQHDQKEITINGSWSIKRDKTDITEQIVKAIEEYCSRDNIEWEYRSEYSAWCD